MSTVSYILCYSYLGFVMSSVCLSRVCDGTFRGEAALSLLTDELADNLSSPPPLQEEVVKIYVKNRLNFVLVFRGHHKRP